eukprot:gene122-733_t
MATEDKRNLSSQTESSSNGVSSFKGGAFFAGVTLISVLAGFGFALARVKKKNPKEFIEVPATKLALKALGLGTALSLSGTALLVFGVKRALGVKTMEDFSNLMKGRMPQKDGDFVKKFESWRLPRKSTNDENDWEKAVS